MTGTCQGYPLHKNLCGALETSSAINMMLGKPFTNNKGSQACIVKTEKGQPINVELKIAFALVGARIYGGDGVLWNGSLCVLFFKTE